LSSKVSFSEEEIKSLGFYGAKSLDAETRERCDNIPLELAMTPVETLFGSASNAALANSIAKQYPPLYRKLKLKAIELGIIAG
jgi:hypothetical protein